MHILDVAGQPVELEFVGELPTPSVTARAGLAGVSAGLTGLTLGPGLAGGALTGAISGVFGLRSEPVIRTAWGSVTKRASKPPPAVFRERTSGLVRIAHREVVIRFSPAASETQRRKLLRQKGLDVRRMNPFISDQIVAVDRKRDGPELVELCNDYVESGAVVVATPNFVSEYRRQAGPPNPPDEQWHLLNQGRYSGQVKGEDVGAVEAWRAAAQRRQVIVAVLDDGVDIDHPNLKQRIWQNSDKDRPDRNGRDFFLPDDHPDHFNPRPKQFTYPYDRLQGNDIHGTPCAGIVAAAGRGAFGIAYRSRVLAVKVFHADQLAQDERVADALRYAAINADVISCSWSGPRSTDIQLAIEDAGRIGRGGIGTAVFCASGNEDTSVGFPAAWDTAIAVGASTDQAQRAPYSNFGPELDLVAPSSGGIQSIFTTDVANPPGRGFNPGLDDLGGVDGLHTNQFGGTSAATPLAAGVAALVLSILPTLTGGVPRFG
jgi:subtilisin family serine protease